MIELLGKTAKTLFFVICILFGYGICEIYHLTKSNKGEKNPKSLKEISVAINEKGELMMMDRSNGSYQFYDDSVGVCIFNLYASKAQSQYINQK